MDSYVPSNHDRHYVMSKQSFNLKDPRKDGLVLQVHHTIPGNQGEIRRVRFVHVTFNETGEQLAASDHRGNIFIIDLVACKFWLLVNLGLCSVLAYSIVNNAEIIVGITNGTLNIVNTEIGKTVGVLKGHTTAVQKLSFAKCRYCLSSSPEEAIIWDLQTNSQLHRLNLRRDVLLKQVFFMPVTNNILACFQDDAIHIWSFETFQCIKQIIPEAWNNHHIRTISFTRNGRAMVIGGHTPTFIIFDLDDWEVKKVFKMPDSMTGIRHLEFVPGFFDGGANKVLGILSEKCGMHFFNTEDFVFFPVPDSLTSGLKRFTCSPSGKYMAVILHTGEINIYKCSKLIDFSTLNENVDGSLKENRPVQNLRSDTTDGRQNVLRRKKNAAQHLQEVHKEIQETLDIQRLRPILKEFGEYPESFRALIWKTILHLPYNKFAYVGLVNRDCSPAYMRLEDHYPLENKSLLKGLKRLLSCLTHWCSLFGEVKFLPSFVFPFVKVFQNDPFACFEAVATIIVNWCQHWFEYFPFPPVNVLAMIENVLSENDPELMNFFYKCRVTSRVYAWPLLENAFTEVLSVSQWLQLWDHVLSNEPAFLLMAVVSYNITCRSALLLCQNLEDFEHFFHNQNAIDMKRLISKAYSLCRKTSNDIHPRQYLQEFTPLPKDSYPSFNQYPKFIVDYQAAQLDVIRKEEEDILREQEEAQKQRLAQDQHLQEEMRKELHEARLLRLEGVYKKTLKKEEERLTIQRQKIAALRRDIRARELQLLEQAQTKLSNQLLVKRSVVMERLLDDIAHKRKQDDNYIATAEDDLRSHLTDVLVQKQKLQMQLDETLTKPHSSIHHQLLQHQQAQLRLDIAKFRDEIKKGQHSKLVELNAQLSALDKKLQEAEVELAKEMILSEINLNTSTKSSRISKLERTTRDLEEEVQIFLHKIANEPLCKGYQKSKVCERRELIEGDQKEICTSYCKFSEENSTFKGGLSESLSSKRRPPKTQSEPNIVEKGFSAKDSKTQKHLDVLDRSSMPSLGNSRSPSYYQRQRKVIDSAMMAREQVLSSMRKDKSV